MSDHTSDLDAELAAIRTLAESADEKASEALRVGDSATRSASRNEVTIGDLAERVTRLEAPPPSPPVASPLPYGCVNRQGRPGSKRSMGLTYMRLYPGSAPKASDHGQVMPTPGVIDLSSVDSELKWAKENAQRHVLTRMYWAHHTPDPILDIVGRATYDKGAEGGTTPTRVTIGRFWTDAWFETVAIPLAKAFGTIPDPMLGTVQMGWQGMYYAEPFLSSPGNAANMAAAGLTDDIHDDALYRMLDVVTEHIVPPRRIYLPCNALFRPTRDTARIDRQFTIDYMTTAAAKLGDRLILGHQGWTHRPVPDSGGNHQAHIVRHMVDLAARYGCHVAGQLKHGTWWDNQQVNQVHGLETIAEAGGLWGELAIGYDGTNPYRAVSQADIDRLDSLFAVNAGQS